jgi:uncharacterized protein YjhX (UPF0386 family)
MSEETEELISGVKGKLGELKGLGALLQFGYSVYTPVVDTGIDCLVDVGEGNYKEIQIKYSQDRGLFQVRATKFTPRDSFYIMCSSPHTYWVIPSKIFSRMAAHTTKYLRLQIGKQGSKNYEALRNYRENLNQLLSGAPKGTRETVSTMRERIKGPYLTQDDCEQLILGELYYLRNTSDENRRIMGLKDFMTHKQIIEGVRQKEERWFSKADFEILKSGEARWHRMTKEAFSNLKRRGLIEAVQQNRYRLSDKGLVFVRQWKAEPYLGEMGIPPPPVEGAVGDRRPHLLQRDFEVEILRAFNRERDTIVRGERIVRWIGAAVGGWMKSGDLVRLKSGEARWERTARWAVSNLTRKGYLQAVQKGQYRVTEEGLNFIDKVNRSGEFHLGLQAIPLRNGRPVRLGSNVPL